MDIEPTPTQAVQPERGYAFARTVGAAGIVLVTGLLAGCNDTHPVATCGDLHPHSVQPNETWWDDVNGLSKGGYTAEQNRTIQKLLMGRNHITSSTLESGTVIGLPKKGTCKITEN